MDLGEIRIRADFKAVYLSSLKKVLGCGDGAFLQERNGAQAMLSHGPNPFCFLRLALSP